MSTRLSIVGLTGSLRAHSVNRGLLRAAQELLPGDARLEIYPVEELPYYNMDLEVDEPGTVRRLKQAVRQADAILIVTPEFNGSVPGVLKNALDWLSRPYGQSAMAGKPTAICGASGSPGGTASAQAHLRHILGRFHPQMRAALLAGPVVQIAMSGDKFDSAGNLQDETSREHIRELLRTLLEATHAQEPAQSS